MGKHKHSKDKLYILQSEYRRDAEIKKKKLKSRGSSFLPFNYCCISLRPFSEPYCDEDGRLYDKKSVLEEMSKDEKDRRIKHSIDIKKLIKANFYKHNNEYICPITRKYFNKHTKIILNRKTGNVYSSEIYKLFHNKNEMFDPITHDKISKEDFIVLQDPLNNKTSYVASHLNDRDQEDNEKKKKNIFAPSIQDNGAIMSILKEMEEAKKEKRKKEQEEEEEKKKKKKVYGILQDYNSDSNESEHSNEKKKMLKNKKDEYNKNIHSTNYDSDSSENEIKIKCTNYSDNKLAQSVTSTISNVTYENSFIYLSENQVHDIIYEKIKTNKKNSYIRLITDVGMLNIELYTHIYPKLCHNFLYLCEYKYYNKSDIFKKQDDKNIVYFGSSKKNVHAAASGFYWRKKLKKYKLRNKLNDEKRIQKFKETLMNENSDNDSDIAIKYIKYNDHRQIQKNNTFGNVYFYKYYNQKYSNMFYISVSENYVSPDICIGKVVGGSDTLNKLKNLDTSSNSQEQYSLNECIIYTNPFKDVIKEMKENIKTDKKVKNEKEDIETFIDDKNYTENKNDNIGKYIKWKDINKNNEPIDKEEYNSKSKLNLKNKESFSKPSKMDFSCW
ncbi:hypothetical protein PFTANZ_02644 [Plasmodium falciparum Tanzania (2000708)]|uniref:PPIase cyclophilin-type domain-containing protein n=1 Tax=Plasmodium falciparum Tanzania (2000708) TaxID=1036725 RepID=A0A024W921_PLAFA|nr:hypothetical protein PFTANZ_02644 [Plasmodium falciparum Tanzania (2000708)]